MSNEKDRSTDKDTVVQTKNTAVNSPGPPDRDQTAEQRLESVPLIPLGSARRRSPVPQELGVNRNTILQKVSSSGRAFKPYSRPSVFSNTKAARDIKERASAPNVDRQQLSRELRNSKSAPDLRAPTLAAIKGLRDGTLQVDQKTRLKIALAAKRVLEAREVQRRSSQESTEPSTKQGETSHARAPSQEATAKTDRISDTGITYREVPRSLGTATAIARGEFLPPPSEKSGQTAAVRGKNQEQAREGEDTRLTAVSQAANLQPASVRAPKPFTVTTGVPRYAQGGGAVGPVTPAASPLSRQKSRSLPIPLQRHPVALDIVTSSPPNAAKDPGRINASARTPQPDSSDLVGNSL